MIFGLRDTDIYCPMLPTMEWTGARDAIYLTFDDGPVPNITERILDMLDEHNARATFFCIARNVERHPALYDQVIARGHAVGNHTYSHLMGWSSPLDEYLADVELAAQYIKSDLFRPPYGRIMHAQADALRSNYRLIMGNAVSRDYSFRVSREKCLRHATERLRGGNIIVFHDSLRAADNMLYALPRTLQAIHSKGLAVRTL